MNRKAKDKRLRYYFNITLKEYEKLLEFQNGVCAICGRPPVNISLSTDHSHTSALVRGLLCMTCNKVLQMFADDWDRFANAINYLISPPAIKALGKEVYGLPGKVGTKKQRKLYKKLKKEGKLYERYIG